MDVHDWIDILTMDSLLFTANHKPVEERVIQFINARVLIGDEIVARDVWVKGGKIIGGNEEV